MKYLKDAAGVVYAFEADGSQDEFMPADLVAMTAAEVEAHLNPPQQPTKLDVDAERDSRMDAGFIFNDVHYQSRATDRENITGAALLAAMAISAGAKAGNLRWSDPGQDFFWIATDNSMVPMDAPTVVELGRAAAARKQALIYAGRQLKDLEEVPVDYADDKWWP